MLACGSQRSTSPIQNTSVEVGTLVLDSPHKVASWCSSDRRACRPLITLSGRNEYLAFRAEPEQVDGQRSSSACLGESFPDRNVVVDTQRDGTVVFDWVPGGAVDDGWTATDAWFSTHDAIGCDCGTTDVLAPGIGHLDGCVRVDKSDVIECRSTARVITFHLLTTMSHNL